MILRVTRIQLSVFLTLQKINIDILSVCGDSVTLAYL